MRIEYKNARVSDNDLDGYLRDLSVYREKLLDVVKRGDYSEPESLVNLPKDRENISSIKDLANKNKSNLKYIFLIGIGGSNLGTLAIYDAFFGYFNKVDNQEYPKIIFIDSVESELLSRVQKLIDEKIISKDEFILNIISKSGKTIEAITNAEIILGFLKNKFTEFNDRVFVTTDKDSELWVEAVKNNWQVLEIPKKIGGRFSVFSSVGLFPLALIGVNIDELLNGAKQALEESLASDRGNIAMISAAVIYHNTTSGKKINDNFFFNPELESLGKWYRQLLAESIGKEDDVNGNKVNVGVTPTVSIGARDLHSVGQLYLAGPKDKLTTFVEVEKIYSEMVISERVMPDLLPEITNKNSNQILSAILEGTKRAYVTKKLPYMEIIFEEINLFSLGWYMQFKMMETMYLAQLFGVNAFDGPEVLLYKIETKNALG